MYSELDFYHASKNAIFHKPEHPFYCTPNNNYKLLYERPNLHRCNLNISAPYHTDNLSLIESLSQFPEKLALLKNMGFDCVVYSKPGNPLRGASGWGNDASQYLVLDPSIVVNWRAIPIPSKLPAQTVEEKNVLGRFHHSASSYFSEFNAQGEIGVHFGTAKAARARERALKNETDVRAEFFGPSKLDIERLNSHQKEPSSEAEMLYFLLLKKLNSPRQSLKETVFNMPVDDIRGTFAEYKDKPDSATFQDSIERAKLGEHYKVLVDGNSRFETTSKELAETYVKAYLSCFHKKADILMNNPLELADLGLWSAQDILKAINPDDETIKAYWEKPDDEKMEFVTHIIKGMGYDGITYKNKVEDEGSVSCIVFEKEQVHQYHERLPEFPSIDCDHALCENLIKLKR